MSLEANISVFVCPLLGETPNRLYVCLIDAEALFKRA